MTAHIWTSLEEDEKIQQLEQREEKLNVVVQDLKKRQKTMDISLRMKVVQELKNLQARSKDCAGAETSKAGSVGAISTTSRRNDRRAPNREGKMGTCTRRKKRSVKRAHNNAGFGDTSRKSAEAKEKATELGKKFHALEVDAYYQSHAS
jgi:hypothetical protein